MIESEVAWSRRSKLGEGPIWWDDRLYWVDIEGKNLLAFVPATGEKLEHDLPAKIGTVVPRKNGGLILGMEFGLAAYDWESQTLEPVNSPSPEEMAGRFNDGKCDPAGRLFIGSMHGDGEASLFRVEPDLTYEVAISGVFTSNGLCWNLDQGLMYYIDSRTSRIDVLDYDADSGKVSGRRPLYTAKEQEGYGKADGMTIDTEGRLWAAHYGGFGVHCIDPGTGKSIEKIEVPSEFTTACWFGGDDLQDLYITSGVQNSSEEDLAKYPETGSLFVSRPGATGLQTDAFAG